LGAAGAADAQLVRFDDGWFWMTVGDGELFRTRERPRERPSGFAYVDYQVVRLWEDVLELLPRAIAPVPSDIAKRLESIEDWLTWFAGFSDRLAEPATEVDADPYELAAKWATDRWLDTAYLVRGPRIFFWRTDDTMHVAWENRHRIDDDAEPIWSNAKGHVSMTIEDFVHEVRDFDDRLMAAMAERIASVQTSWPHPGVIIDLVQLDHEQEQRSTWLSVLCKPRPRRTGTPSARRSGGSKTRTLPGPRRRSPFYPLTLLTPAALAALRRDECARHLA
jgi:hypothetical protein